MPIITSNIDAPTGNAVVFTRSSETFDVVAGVVVMAEVGSGLSDTSNGFESVVNAGDIFGGVLGDGIQMAGGQGNLVINKSSGTIVGIDGILYSDVSNTTENYGFIRGVSDGVAEGGGAGLIENYGTITGGSAGILAGDGETIYNQGVISSAAVGVNVIGFGAAVAIANKGQIRGKTSSISISGASPIAIANSGALEGNVKLSDTGGDTFGNAGTVVGSVQLGNGANSFDNRGGVVTGAIAGGSATDVIFLGNHGETVNGGAGHDRLIGGTGADTFQFTSLAAADSDLVVGFNVVNDMISLAHSTFTALVAGAPPTFSIAPAATSAADHLFYNSATGFLFYDPDGNGALAADPIARLAAGLHLTSANFVVV